MTQLIKPNIPDPVNAATDTSAVPSFDAIAQKMTVMREQTIRNQLRATDDTATGQEGTAETSSPVAPNEIVPEDDANLDASIDDATLEDDTQPEAVSAPEETTSDELIDFIEFADENPNAKFKFVRNGKEVVIDAKKAAAILGQGGAIHEEARQLKIERAEFDEYIREQRSRQEGLTLAMEFTVQPQLQSAYDEILKTQGYQTVFQQQMARTTDPAQRARIQASMQQNEQYIAQQQAVIGHLKPAVDQFKEIRREQVKEVLENNRKSFQDKELKNEYVYNELRDKLSKAWAGSKAEIIPGITNIDLISSDETLLGLVRDGLKYRNASKPRTAGNSIAALTARRGATQGGKNNSGDIERLRDQAKSGDKKAADNLLVARLKSIRAARG